MTNQLNIRKYVSDDKFPVLSLLRLNTPTFFSPDEEKEFLFFLENEIEYYFVVELDHKTVGCGGFNFSNDKQIGKICWDIVHPDYHGKSIGSTLLGYRISEIKKLNPQAKITVRTSQLAYKFYEKYRFQLIEIREDYWAKGFHLYSMEYVK